MKNAKTTKVASGSKTPGSKAPVSHGVGRRKSSVARVWLRRGNGTITVNGKDYKKYFDTDVTRADAVTAMNIVPNADKYNVDVNVKGGGPCSQAGATRLGIARALLKVDISAKKELRDQGLLTVDSRLKERKKPGQPGARKKFQFVKR